jgi:hypothetical protein
MIAAARRLLQFLTLAQFCERHGQGFTGDFCPGCLEARATRLEVVDQSGPDTKPQGTWPIRRPIAAEDNTEESAD